MLHVVIVMEQELKILMMFKPVHDAVDEERSNSSKIHHLGLLSQKQRVLIVTEAVK